MARTTDDGLGLMNRLGTIVRKEAGRTVVLAARITPGRRAGTTALGGFDLEPVDEHARVPGGRVAPTVINDGTGCLELMTWNTGEASDLGRYGNLTHAERQFRAFVEGRRVASVAIELTHSPCTACADMLAGWLTQCRAAASVPVLPRREGRRVTMSAPPPGAIAASLRWTILYKTQPQATTWPCLDTLHAAGWRLAAPRSALPEGSGLAPVTLL